MKPRIPFTCVCENLRFLGILTKWLNLKPFSPLFMPPDVGDSVSPCAGRWCTDSCSMEVKHTETQYLTWFGKTAYIHGRESILLEIEKGNNRNTWRRRITSLKLNSQLSHTAAHGSSSSFSLILSTALTIFSLSAQFALLFCCLFIGKNGATAPALLQQRWLPTPSLLQQWWLLKSMVGAVHLLHINGNKPNNHPLCHSCGATVLLLLQHRLASCNSSELTILRASVTEFTGTRQTFQSPELPKHTFSHTKGSLQPEGLPHHI